MENLKMEANWGDNFNRVKQKAKELAAQKDKLVEFEFNGVICVVSSETNLDNLYRDYGNAHLMEWKTVGPNCLNEYDEVTKSELQRRTIESEEKHEKEAKAYREKEQKKKLSFNEKIANEVFECADEELMKTYEEKNKDPYGGRCVSYAKEWARAMQFEIKQGNKLVDIADATSREADYDGITGFMYGASVAILSKCWKYGEDLRKWHNKEYNHEGDGVVNPAIITL